jgi:cation diffusion facilitator CzcD-associated flavoprotein CzcO
MERAVAPNEASRPQQATASTEPANAPQTHYRVAIAGTGFAGVGAAIRLSQEGIEDFVIFERADDFGGTWRDNSYPGCACDVPSHLYSFSFEPNADWSRTFSAQPEIHAYLRRCAEKYRLRARTRFGHEILGADWNADRHRWDIETSEGSYSADVLISGMGALSDPAIPDIPGLSAFTGATFHSATWQHDCELAGKRVAVIGTGASAIQFVPQVQPDVARLDLYQRTPPWIMPRSDRPIRRIERALFRAVPATQRMMRGAIYWARESWVLGFRHPWIMRIAERIARRHLRRQVSDPQLRAKLTPTYRLGCKRVLISNDYLRSLDNTNVEIVDNGIHRITATGVIDSNGVEREVDAIIFGTGFQIGDLPASHRIRGAAGLTLAESWSGSMQAHRGTTVAGFPNFFTLLGPNTGLGHTSVVYMIEAQIEYVLRGLRTMEHLRAVEVDTRPEAQAAFNERLQEQMTGTVWTQGGCASWYLDDSGRNTTLWPSFTFRYRQAVLEFDPEEHELRRSSAGVTA